MNREYRNGRDEAIDCTKGLGILAVLAGHILPWGSVPSKLLYVFHMPLFFFLSGLVYKRRSESTCATIKHEICKGLFSYIFFIMASFGVILLVDPQHALTLFSRGGLKSLASSPVINFSLWFLISITEIKILFGIMEV